MIYHSSNFAGEILLRYARPKVTEIGNLRILKYLQNFSSNIKSESMKTRSIEMHFYITDLNQKFKCHQIIITFILVLKNPWRYSPEDPRPTEVVAAR